MRDHRDLDVWNRAMDLVVEVYKITNDFPRSETFGLSAQMRRAAISVASNIAEGAARRTTKDFVHFVHVARGSLLELQTQITIASRLGMQVESPDVITLATQVGQQLNGLLRALRRKISEDKQKA